MRNSSFSKLALFLAIFVLDRATKSWAVDALRGNAGIAVFPFFHLTYVENTGAAFGIGTRNNGFFLAVSVVLLGCVLYLLRRWRGAGPWVCLGLSAVAAGALGNIYDRIVYGHVIDFLDFRVWPVFNVADSAITVGAASAAWGLSGLSARAQK